MRVSRDQDNKQNRDRDQAGQAVNGIRPWNSTLTREFARWLPNAARPWKQQVRSDAVISAGCVDYSGIVRPRRERSYVSISSRKRDVGEKFTVEGVMRRGSMEE